MAAQHPRLVHIAGVPRVAGDVGGVVAEVVVVVGDRDDAVAGPSADFAAPVFGQRAGGQVDEQLEGMWTGGRIGEVADGEVTGELSRGEWSRHDRPPAPGKGALEKSPGPGATGGVIHPCPRHHPQRTRSARLCLI